MDTRDGRIYTDEEYQKMTSGDKEFMAQMGHHPTPAQRANRKVGRNEACPCGSRKKFKKCCLWKA